jgi:peptide/nickel transport system permease protein
MPQPVFFVTDLLFFVLLAVALGYVLYARRHEHLRAPWRAVARDRLAMVAAVCLGFYSAVALLDSIHYRQRLGDGPDGQVQYAMEVLSLLDTAMGQIRTQVETTYSAPLALRSYAKVTEERPDGAKVRLHPRLQFAAPGLEDTEHLPDLLATMTRGLAEGLAAAAAVCLVLVAGLARRAGRSLAAQWAEIRRGQTSIPWGTVLLAIAVGVVAVVLCARLGVRYHLFGTDKVGQDVFFQAVKSIRTGLVIGTLTTLLMLPFALALGLMAGYFGGLVDDFIQYLYTTLSSIPGVLLIAAAILVLQAYLAAHEDRFLSLAERADLRLLFLCIILGITSWTGLCRLLRAETLKLREQDYVAAAVAFGVGSTGVMARHILPNVFHIVLIAVVLDFSDLVLAEAVLSYINIGVDPTMQSWGNMINAARMELAREPVIWWSLTAAFGFMFVLVLAANLFADAVRDAFDPRLRQRIG